LLAYCGLRIGEALALRVRDLDLMRGRLSVERAVKEVGGHLMEGPCKTDGSVRVVILPPSIRDELARQVAAYSDPSNPDALLSPTRTADRFERTTGVSGFSTRRASGRASTRSPTFTT
jgi:integrase